MSLRMPLKSVLLFVLAVLVMFLPRRLYFLGVYGYRVVILLVLFVFLIKSGPRVKIHRFIRNPFLLLYFGVSIIVYIKYNAVISLVGYLLDTIILFFLLTNLISSEKALNGFIKVFSSALILYSFFGVIELVTGFNIWNTITGNNLASVRFGLNRCFGAISTPINNGLFMILCMPILMNAIIQTKGTKEHGFYIFSYIMVCVNLICTLSRAPILAGLALNILWLLKRGLFEYIKTHLRTVAVMCVLVFCIYQIPAVAKSVQVFSMMFRAITDENIASSISSSFGSNAKGVGERLELYEWVWESVQGNILLGKGPYQEFGYVWYDQYYNSHTKESIENQYLACLFRFGVIGLITMALFFISCLIMIQKRRCVSWKTQNHLSTSFLVLTTILVYYVLFFTVAMAEDTKMFYILLAVYFLGEEQKRYQRNTWLTENKVT